MLTFAVIATLAALAVPATVYIRMLATGPQTRREIHTRMSDYRRSQREVPQ